MNRYILIRRMRGPAFLILLGIVALLHKLGVVEHTWTYFWPMALILLGALMLAERAALHSEEQEAALPYPGAASYPASPAAPVETSTAIVPVAPQQNEEGEV